MEKEIFSVCDYAQDANGKLIIISPFDTIWAKEFPVKHQSMTVVARIKFDQEEIGKHNFEISLKNKDNKELLPTLKGEAVINKPKVGNFATLNIVFTLNMIPFEKSGLYKFELVIDGNEFAYLTINLVKR